MPDAALQKNWVGETAQIKKFIFKSHIVQLRFVHCAVISLYNAHKCWLILTKEILCIQIGQSTPL